jgi:FtsZ-binding cell division protein ZapB
MKLDQFDRLQQLVKDSADVIVKLKFENKALTEKNTKLQEALSTKTEKTAQKLKRMEEENIVLRQRQEKVTSRLMHLRNKLRSLTTGVES